MTIFSGEPEGNLSVGSNQRVITVVLLHEKFDEHQVTNGSSQLQGRPKCSCVYIRLSLGPISLKRGPVPMLFLGRVSTPEYRQAKSQ